MIIVTGGAGFIGSCIVRELNNMGYEDIIIVDNIQKTEKWKNMRNKRYLEYISRNDFSQSITGICRKSISCDSYGCVFSYTELDFDFLYKNNFEYTKTLWNFVQKINVLLLCQQCSNLWSWRVRL